MNAVSVESIDHLFSKCEKANVLWENVNLFIWGFTSLSTLYRSYHDG